jgi:hypothetical protein
MKKLTTLAQIAALNVGGTIKRFPTNSDDKQEEVFDEKRIKSIDTFTIRDINPQTQMFSLVTTHDPFSTFASSVNVGRLFIKTHDLISENVWWV